MAISTQNARNQFKKCIGNTINTSEIPENKNPTIQIVVDNTKKIQNNFEKGRTLISYQGNYRIYHQENRYMNIHQGGGPFHFSYKDTVDIVTVDEGNSEQRDIVTIPNQNIDGQFIDIRVDQYIRVSIPGFRRSTSNLNDFGEYWITRDGNIDPKLSLFISSRILQSMIRNPEFKFNFNNNKFFLEFLNFNLYINVNEDFNSNILYHIDNHPYRIYFDKDLKQTQKIPLTQHPF